MGHHGRRARHGPEIAKAALAAGHKVVATGRNTDKVAQAVGESADLLVVKLDVTSPADAEAAVEGCHRPVWPHRCAREQCRELLRGLLRGADAGADGAPAGDEPSRADERHPRRPAGHAQAAFRADHLISSSAGFAGFEFGTAYAASKFGLEGWMEVAAGRGRAVRHPDPHRQPGLLPYRTSHRRVDELRRAPSIDDYDERREQQLAFWNSQNGKQSGDPAKLAQALITLAGQDELPRRFIAGADPSAPPSRRSRCCSSRSTPTVTSRPRWRSKRYAKRLAT